MEAKISKAQIEVWEWKEKAYNQIKNLSSKERIQFILLQTIHIMYIIIAGWLGKFGTYSWKERVVK